MFVKTNTTIHLVILPVIRDALVTSFWIENEGFLLEAAGFKDATLIPQFQCPCFKGLQDFRGEALASGRGGYIHPFDLHGLVVVYLDRSAAQGRLALVENDDMGKLIDLVVLVVISVLIAVFLRQISIQVLDQCNEVRVV